ncbi:MAG: (2Fe-2S)-binding protein [Alphaproteobacteria bacterium]|nr:(2Fe-2S)-binding protein [Alphaproteobacteria bacterium]MCB9794740.1 (2Fe-2S)-binding protein [Alphaproteobacteria bacterium]
MSDTFLITVDGKSVRAHPGETVLTAAERAGVHIPTFCHDPRLTPTGACRMCLVEVEGQRRLQPSCAWKAEPGQVVKTEGERVEKHRAVLLSMYLADHTQADDGLPPERAVGNKLRAYAEARDDLVDLPPVHSPREGREDANPYIVFDPDACILCARCTRYCDEVEGVSAIQLVARGGETTIGTSGLKGLLDTSCELCGGCIAICPTGALFERKSPQEPHPSEQLVRSTCNFCGVGCQVDLRVRDDKVVAVEAPPPGTTVNDGNLCVKGRFAFDFIHHEERLTQPLVRRADGLLHETSWEEALSVAAAGLARVRDTHGGDALGFVSSSRCTGEENYLMQKLSRAAFGTNNCHQCAAT